MSGNYSRLEHLPHALARLTDALICRLEHNLRAATTLGIVDAGSLGWKSSPPPSMQHRSGEWR